MNLSTEMSRMQEYGDRKHRTTRDDKAESIIVEKKDYLLDPWIKLILLLFKARKITYNQSVARTELRTMEEAQLIQVTEALKHISTETNQKYLHAIDRIKNGAERYIDF